MSGGDTLFTRLAYFIWVCPDCGKHLGESYSECERDGRPHDVPGKYTRIEVIPSLSVRS